MNTVVFKIIFSMLFFINRNKETNQFLYNSRNLELTRLEIRDSLRRTTLLELPSKQPEITLRRDFGTPIMNNLWRNALADVESNIVTTPTGRYFGAGKKFGLLVYTRDISFSGLLALNELYPEVMLSSLKVTRKVRLGLGLTVSRGYIVDGLKGNWQEEKYLKESDFVQKYKTNSYTRRTDDVIWLWATKDLFTKNKDIADWDWMYTQGMLSFETLYWPFYDAKDGLFRGQSSFIDIHYENEKATGYPPEYTISDCVLLKALSTNCLYYEGMLSMAEACKNLGKSKEELQWTKRAENLKKAILKELSLGDGTYSYYKDKDGKLQNRRDALGSALMVLTGIVKGKNAKRCLANYPETWAGIPIIHPFYPWKTVYHNNTSWPFVDTFFLWAKEKAYGKDFRNYNAALAARTCFDGQTFRELVNFNTKEPYRSTSQLWTASSFLNVCLRSSSAK